MNDVDYKYDYAVVVPVFENNGILIELADLLEQTFTDLNKSYQLILVDDSKSNQSWKYVQEIYQKNKENTVAIRLSRNYGQHNATVCGFRYVNAPWVITMDDDLEIYPNQIPLLIGRQKETEADVVSGEFNRTKGGVFFNLLNKTFVNSGEKIKKERSTKSSFRLICKRLTDRLLEFPHHFIFIDRVLMWYTQSIEFVKVDHFKSQKPISGYQKKGLFSLLTNILFFFSSIPIKAMSYFAFVLSFFTFLFGMYRVYAKLINNTPLGYTSIIVSILFSTSMILFALGLIGEYLRRIYSILNNQPVYEIKSILK